LLRSIEQLSPISLTHCALVAHDGDASTIRLPRPMLGISRCAFDLALLDGARAAGATILQPARVEFIDADLTTLTVRDLITNAITTLGADYILLADGKPAAPSPRTGDFGVKAHFAGVQDAAGTISLFGLRGHYIGLAPIENGLHNAAMSVPAVRIRAFKSDLDALFAQCLRENTALAACFGDARRVSPWLASPLPRFRVAPTWHPRVIPLGNAAAALEPIGGEGIGLALRSAELLAAWLGASRKPDLSDLRTAFARLWRTRSLVSRVGAMLLSRPRLSRVATRLANPLTLRLVGK
jgi:2-polyprenyl-6-methoxyphenol hydroxylase-like FAD-dependent oxidoreductase